MQKTSPTENIMRESLRQSEEKFRELAENTTDSFILSSGNKIIYVNPAFEQVYGYSRDELIRDPELLKKWIHPSDKERILNVMRTGALQVHLYL